MNFKKLIERHLLLEFDETKTWGNFGNKLLSHILSDRSFPIRVPSGRIGPDGKLEIEKEELDKVRKVFFDGLKEHDPTQNQEYGRWIAQTYASGGISFWEDIVSRVKDVLFKYNKLKIQKKLNPEEKDIFRIKTLPDLEDIVNNHSDQMDSRSEKEDAEMEKAKSESDLFFSDGNCYIIKPKTFFAAQYWGKGTSWCTSLNASYYKNYATSGNLYIFIPKKQKYAGEKYQMHTPSRNLSNIQLADKTDRMVEFKDVLSSHPEFTNAFWKIFGIADHNVVEGVRAWEILGFAGNELLKFVVEKKDKIEKHKELFTSKFCDWVLNNRIASEYVKPTVALGNLDLDLISKIYLNNSGAVVKSKSKIGKEQIIKTYKNGTSITTIDNKKTLYLSNKTGERIVFSNSALHFTDGKPIGIGPSVAIFGEEPISDLIGIDIKILNMTHRYDDKFIDPIIWVFKNKLLDYDFLDSDKFAKWISIRPWKFNQMKTDAGMKSVFSQFKET